MEPPSKKARADRWTAEETRILINTYEAYMIGKLFDGTVRDSEVYKKMAIELNNFGVCRSEDQIKNRLKVLKKKYKEAKDKLRVSGAGSSISFPFFDEMDKVMGHRDVVNPPISVDIGFGHEETMNQSTTENLSFEELDSTLPIQSTLELQEEVEELDCVQEVEISGNTSTINKPSKNKGRKRKRKDQYEVALRNVMEDVTSKVLDFEMKMEQKAEEKREAFREKVLKNQKELMELFKMSIDK